VSLLFIYQLSYKITCSDANTIGSIAAVASIDWGCAVQVMAAANIGSNGEFSATNAQTLYVAIVLVSYQRLIVPTT